MYGTNANGHGPLETRTDENLIFLVGWREKCCSLQEISLLGLLSSFIKFPGVHELMAPFLIVIVIFLWKRSSWLQCGWTSQKGDILFLAFRQKRGCWEMPTLWHTRNWPAFNFPFGHHKKEEESRWRALSRHVSVEMNWCRSGVGQALGGGEELSEASWNVLFFFSSSFLSISLSLRKRSGKHHRHRRQMLFKHTFLKGEWAWPPLFYRGRKKFKGRVAA